MPSRSRRTLNSGLKNCPRWECRRCFYRQPSSALSVAAGTATASVGQFIENTDPLLFWGWAGSHPQRRFLRLGCRGYPASSTSRMPSPAAPTDWLRDLPPVFFWVSRIAASGFPDRTASSLGLQFGKTWVSRWNEAMRCGYLVSILHARRFSSPAAAKARLESTRFSSAQPRSWHSPAFKSFISLEKTTTGWPLRTTNAMKFRIMWLRSITAWRRPTRRRTSLFQERERRASANCRSSVCHPSSSPTLTRRTTTRKPTAKFMCGPERP